MAVIVKNHGIGSDLVNKFFSRISLLYVWISFVALCADAQDFRLGVIDTQRVIEGYKKAKEADAELKALEERLTTRLKGLEDEIVVSEERLTKQELFLDDDAVRAARQDIRIKQEEYRQRLENGQQALIEKQKELLEPIIEEVKVLIEEIGKNENYSLILDQRLTVGAYSIPVALYVSPKYDLTERIIKTLNAKYGRPKKKESASEE